MQSSLQSETTAELSADAGAGAVPPTLTSLVKPFEEWKGYIRDLSAYMEAFIGQMRSGGGQNDRLLLLERLVTWMSYHPDSILSRKLEHKVIDLLYKDLPHPPVGYLSLPTSRVDPTNRKHMHVTYVYRSADGSDYNVMMPNIGRAQMPYARSVPSRHPLPPQFLPDAGLVFDVLLKRDKFTPHPGGVSSLFFAFADLVIHSIFNTDLKDPTINNSSSYLDLSPLYGSSDEQVNSVRRKDGSGRLYEDVFADSRIMFMPPSACALLILLCRNHNYIADKILRINEKGHYREPSQMDEQDRLSQDDEIFQRARLVNCGFFMQIILADYVGAILGLVRDGRTWRLKILEDIRRDDHTLTPRGEGNAVAVEFNLMYRWHATLSEPDTQWVTEKFQSFFPGRDLDQLTPEDLKQGYRPDLPPSDKREWSFGGLKRTHNGRFNDGELADILQNATEASASAFKARGIPEALKVVELLGIEQARSWGTCSLNEFRQFMGLQPYNSFAEWNPDPEIHAAAESLYHDVNNLELYVGLLAEEAKQPTPGAGLCPGYTVSRAILSDAVCLVRGDRFMTIDFTPENFTAWGYQDCQIPQNDGSYGGMLTKLLFRHLPEYYTPGSAYAHFPFLVPEMMKLNMEKRQGPVADYIWSRPISGMPILPQPSSSLQNVEVSEVHQARVRNLTGVTFQRKPIEDLILEENLQEAFSKATRKCIEAHSISAVGNSIKYIDIARDVVNAVPLQWISELIGLPPDFDPRDLAEYAYDGDEEDCVLHNKARDIAGVAMPRINAAIRGLSSSMAGGYDVNSPDGESQPGPVFGNKLLRQSDASGRSPEALAVDFIGDVLATAPLFSRTIVRTLHHMLRDQSRAYDLFHSSPSLASDAAILAYVGEVIDVVDDVGVRFGLMSSRFIEEAGIPMLRSIVAQCGLTRGPGKSGELTSLTDDLDAISKAVYLNTRGQISPWPISLVLQYDSMTPNRYT
ncbi:heme peroxidase [Trametopsis cervina]|nr:heme peroxidase [Trametopsis cervina]